MRLLALWAMERVCVVSKVRCAMSVATQRPAILLDLTLNQASMLPVTFFIDCSRLQIPLLGSVMGVACRIWTHWLPCDRPGRPLAEKSRRANPLYVPQLVRPDGFGESLSRHRTGTATSFRAGSKL